MSRHHSGRSGCVPSINVQPVFDPDYVYQEDYWYPDDTYENDNWSVGDDDDTNT